MSSKYTFGKEVPLSFDEAVSRATEAVAKEGFGVLAAL
jgi:uncharacterized protein (DUF302 family)